ncbi:MAG: glycosyltransferase family 4 protein [Acidimicrobiales bacterium]|nr:glycosyltransferase family 4 protein [Acidimicrobiales bacterium]
MSSVDLLVPELKSGDAIGAHTLLLRDVFVAQGATVRFVAQQPSSMNEDVLLVSAWKKPGDLIVLQHGIGSLLAEAVIKRRLPAVLNYHNITPPEFVEAWDADHIAGLRWGRAQLHQLAPLAPRAVADSQYNANELIDVGFADVRVAPVLWNVRKGNDRQVDHDAPVILFVGRVAANKCHHDLIAALAALTTTHPTARLVVVGSPASESYQRALDAFAKRLGVGGHVDFVGAVDDATLAAHLANAAVFLCLSEHEGFCVPVVEAMAAGVPVIAYDAAVLSETVGDAGILLGDKTPHAVATAVARVLDEPGLEQHLIDRGRQRADDFSLAVSSKAHRAAFDGLVAR